ncbi:MAG: hypothetical protein BVN35_06200 [Proteobacteria bacterium ST_bin11]|nr:MAG: hypothetical protein BVN35_06200 [Proteobacteria bacterium ST_bin11]
MAESSKKDSVLNVARFIKEVKNSTVPQIVKGTSATRTQEQFQRPEAVDWIKRYFTLLNVDVKTVNKLSRLRKIYDTYKEKNALNKPREIKVEQDIIAGVLPSEQAATLNLTDTYYCLNSEGGRVSALRWELIAYVFPGHLKKGGDEHSSPVAYLETFIKTLILRYGGNNSLAEMPAANLFFFLDRAPQGKGAVYGATPALLTANPRSLVEQTAAQRDAYTWEIFDAHMTMKSIKKYGELFKASLANDGKASSSKDSKKETSSRVGVDPVAKLFKEGNYFMQLDTDWWIPIAGTYRCHDDASSNYLTEILKLKQNTKKGKKTAASSSSAAADDDDEDEGKSAKRRKPSKRILRHELDDDDDEDNDDENVEAQSSDTNDVDDDDDDDDDEGKIVKKRQRTAKSNAVLSSHGKLPPLKKSVDQPKAASSTLPPLPKLPSASTSKSASSSKATMDSDDNNNAEGGNDELSMFLKTLKVPEESVLSQLEELFGDEGTELCSRGYHEQLHGMLSKQTSEMFEEIASRVKDNRLNPTHRFVSPDKPDGELCFRRPGKHFLIAERKAGGLSSEVRLPPHLWGVFSFFNQENSELARDNVRGALEVFPTAKTHWGVEAVTPLDAETVPCTPANAGLIKAINLSTNDALFYVEREQKRLMRPMIVKARLAEEALRSSHSELAALLDKANKRIKELEARHKTNSAKFTGLREKLKSTFERTKQLEAEKAEMLVKLEQVEAQLASAATAAVEVNDDDADGYI